MLYFTTLLLSMFITIVLIPILKGLGAKVNAIDMPNPRKVHTTPIPTVGGAAMAIGTLVPVLLWLPPSPQVKSILIGATIIVAAGVVDDVKDLGYKIKFAAQVVAAIIIIFYGKITISNLGVLLPDGYVLSNMVSAALTLLVIVGVTNAINLSDGLDGLAGGITLLTFICIGYLAFRSENHIITITALASAGAIFGFLRFNTYPATVFMGDAGSQFLGFMAIVLSIAITQDNTPVSPYLPLIILGFPVLDTLTVMTERIASGRSPFVADKNHFQHKLMRVGMFHTEAVFTIYVLQTTLVITAILFRYYSDWLFISFYFGFAAIVTFS
ncbi:Undecaprenyl-phosphate alpha-N-acetylglucosaminyl 1-phosphate transferase (EC [Olavius algarvensis associated proteobacterium Delta 3]|nr:Undecaprenyl-phosphate alpha-N-acetylglucosaminyl 1-phosphate transferase (EC [Olavius algarvensis associated proteobacterium Delta 3]